MYICIHLSICLFKTIFSLSLNTLASSFLHGPRPSSIGIHRFLRNRRNHIHLISCLPLFDSLCS
ncbi:hypothetical protein V6Z12_D03G086800 [Gossypium hirsutum]|uniref:Secreted protein n=1 Tax=Gossypium tomentosum TaxID=34277 RepID=A0A5D2LLD2_GOSTO|nr:hypothetical protein ES332_D03G095200v1 [Gossypium tomentosum]